MSLHARVAAVRTTPSSSGSTTAVGTTPLVLGRGDTSLVAPPGCTFGAEPVRTMTSPPGPVSSPQLRRRPNRLAFWTVRILLGLLALIVLLALGGASYEAIMAAGDDKRYPPPGQLVDVGGYRLHLHCIGQGSPTVVLDAGLGAFSLDWGAVQPNIAMSTRVCAYDRAGLGWSEPSPTPRTPQQFASELHALLTKGGVEGPYVLVAHSISGKTARLFASQHPDEVAGMVLVDARHEYVDDHRTPEQLAAEDAEQRQFQNMIRWMARFGLVRLLWAPAWPSMLPGSENLTPWTRTAIGVLQARPRQIENALAEGGAEMDSNTLLRTAALGATPLIVLASGQNVDHDPFWKEAQQIMTGLSSNSRLIIAQSGHAVHFEQPAQVVESIRQVVDAARTGQSLKP
jgi:pimeloyl-ACP methyl ester carboxylesterase